ncbi:MAG: hypothetical protein C0490_00390 [Marivirga sp.]|nr:hypothetical protein [Marivirga sp.]
MEFKRLPPSEELKDIIECYWLTINEVSAPSDQKIIPDGFPEIILHFGDPYKIRIKQQWELQPANLLAGQITRYFYLQNTGRSDILGIKFKPAALTHLFKISMHEITDCVVGLNNKIPEHMLDLKAIREPDSHLQKLEIIEKALKKIYITDIVNTPIEKSVSSIFSTNGMTSVTELCDITGTSERQLQRIFKKYIGLSPKFYARIIRFSHIFQVVKEKKLSGSGLGLEAGFYDQSHFIKNFKAFTGEDPSRYFFDQPSLANFFLKK